MPGRLRIPKVDLRDRLMLSVAEVCALTNLSQGTVYALIKSGELRSLKGKRAYIVMRTDLDAWLDSLPRAYPGENVGSSGDDSEKPLSSRHF